jgi:hypothetical protein
MCEVDLYQDDVASAEEEEEDTDGRPGVRTDSPLQ